MKNLKTLWSLTTRNIKIFSRDKISLFFSFLAPLILLFLYVAFLQNIQVDSINSVLENAGAVSNATGSVVATWMVSSLLSITIITVPINTFMIMVKDKERKTNYDFMVSPVKNNIKILAYLLSSFIISLVLTLIIFAICLVYLAIGGMFTLSFLDILATIGVIILSIISITLIIFLIANFFNKESQLGAFTGIWCACSGFFIGAYMPLSIMPAGIQYISGILPATYSTGIFKNILMRGAFNDMANTVSAEILNGIKDYFDLKLNFFGLEISHGVMYAFVGGSILLFGLLSFLLFRKAQKIKK